LKIFPDFNDLMEKSLKKLVGDWDQNIVTIEGFLTDASALKRQESIPIKV
jgi:hypothetical protein